MEDEEAAILKMFEEGRRRKREFDAELRPAQFKIILEGFKAELNEVQISDTVRIYKADLPEREAFYKRSEEINTSQWQAEKNEFFLTFDFELERKSFISIKPGQQLSVISIFFAVCSKAFLVINKGQLYEKHNGTLYSRGLFKSPLRPLEYDSNIVFDQHDIAKLQQLWPLFLKAFNSQAHFGLIARRFYYSLNRHGWSDRLIDLMILAEALVLPEDSRNKGGQIAKRVSRLLARHPERNEINMILRDAYNLRNQVVHGEIVDEENSKAVYVTTLTSNYLKLAIQEYLLSYSTLTPLELVAQLELKK